MRRQPLVLLHGWGSDERIWEPLLAALQRNGTVMALNLNPLMENARSAADVVRQLSESTPPGAVWIGSSLGGTLAGLLAREHPVHVSGLCTIGTSPCFVQRHDWRHAMSAEDFAGFEQGLAGDPLRTCRRFQTLATQGTSCSRQSLRRLGKLTGHLRLRLAPLRLGLRILRETDLRPDWASPPVPHAAIFGSQDALVPVTVAQALDDAAGLQKHVIDGHHLPWLSSPARLSRLVEDFVEGASA